MKNKKVLAILLSALSLSCSVASAEKLDFDDEIVEQIQEDNEEIIENSLSENVKTGGWQKPTIYGLGSFLLALNGGYLISSLISKQKDNENQGDKSQKDESQNDKKRKNKKQENNDEKKEVSNYNMNAIENGNSLTGDKSQDDENKGVNDGVPEHEKILSLVKKLWDGNTYTNYFVGFSGRVLFDSNLGDEKKKEALLELIKIFSKKIPDDRYYYFNVTFSKKVYSQLAMTTNFSFLNNEQLTKNLKINYLREGKADELWCFHGNSETGFCHSLFVNIPNI